MKTETSSSPPQLRLAATSEKCDEDDMTAEELGSSRSSSASNNGDDDGILTLKEKEQKMLAAQKQEQQQKQKQRFKILAAGGLVVLVGAALAALFAIFGNTYSYSWSSSSTSGGGCAKKNQKTNQPQQQQQQQQQGGSSSSSSWISLKLPEGLSLHSPYGALAMNTDGSILAIGDPMRDQYWDENPQPYPGRVIMLVQDDQGEEEEPGVSYRTVQVLQAPNDDYNKFGTALALSSSTTNTTLVVGIPRNSGLLSNDPQPAAVQVFVQRTTAASEHDHYWEMADEFPNQSRNDEAGSWVVVSDDGSRILYSAPSYGAAGEVPQEDDQVYNPTRAGAVLLWHNGEQEAFLLGECKDQDEAFGQTVSMSSGVDGAPPVVVITRAGCWTNETYRTITVWEGGDDGDSFMTNLVVRDPNEDCVMGGTGTAAQVSRDGKRIVVLAACLDQHTYQTHQAIYTFEKDELSQDWVERVSNNNNVPVVVIDSDLVQYRMSTFAFDDDAKTVVLTASGGVVNKVPSTDLVCYKWNETIVSWQESWRKVANENDSDFGSFIAVALSGNGKRLAIIRSNYENTTQLAVYSLP